MKRKLLGKIILGLGGIFLLKGMAFNFLRWNDIFFGVYVGAIILIIGLLILLAKPIQRASIDGKEQLSSRITFVYKYVIPSVLLVIIILYFTIILTNRTFLDFFIPIGFFIVFMFIALLFIGINVYDVWYNSSQISFLGLRHNLNFPLSEVLSINRFLFNFYYIKMRNGKRYYFIPHILQLIENPAQDPPSILKIKNILME